MSLFGRAVEEWFDSWYERRTLPGLLRQRLAHEPAAAGSLVDELAAAIARHDAELVEVATRPPCAGSRGRAGPS